MHATPIAATGSVADAQSSEHPGDTAGLMQRVVALYSRIPDALIQPLARISVAVTFWTSGQTKIEGLVLDPIGLTAQVGWPHVSDGAIDLFQSEYALPLLPPSLAATMAATAEHVFPLLLVLGLATRMSATGLLVMTLVIQLLVYPDAWPTHGLWMALMLYLMAKGPGALSIDHLIARRAARRTAV